MSGTEIARVEGLRVWDSRGRPTTDPAAAIEGLLRPIGDHKGANLAMVSGILSTLLSGAGYGTEPRGTGRGGARPADPGWRGGARTGRG